MQASNRLSHDEPAPSAQPPASTTPAPTLALSPAPSLAPSLAPAPASNPPLSATEKRVYALLLQRLTERQVAEHLERSHNTIHVHVRNIYRKLGIRSRQELFRYHRQNARAEPPSP